MDQLERRLVGDLGGVVLEELLLELAVRLHERGRAAAAAVGAPRAAGRRHYCAPGVGALPHLTSLWSREAPQKNRKRGLEAEN